MTFEQFYDRHLLETGGFSAEHEQVMRKAWHGAIENCVAVPAEGYVLVSVDDLVAVLGYREGTEPYLKAESNLKAMIQAAQESSDEKQAWCRSF